jgi:hypothetical protein
VVKYIHTGNSKLVIQATGGYRILEQLGYKPEQEIEREKKKEEQKEKFKQFVESQPFIDKTCPICNKNFKTRSIKTRTDSIKCGQQLRRKEGR